MIDIKAASVDVVYGHTIVNIIQQTLFSIHIYGLYTYDNFTIHINSCHDTM